MNSSVRKLSEGSGTVWYVICEISVRSSSLRELCKKLERNNFVRYQKSGSSERDLCMIQERGMSVRDIVRYQEGSSSVLIFVRYQKRGMSVGDIVRYQGGGNSERDFGLISGRGIYS